MLRVAVQLEQDLALAAPSPLKKAVVVVGDWNFCAEGESGFSLASAFGDFLAVNTPPMHQSASLAAT